MKQRAPITGTLAAVVVALLCVGHAGATEISFIESPDGAGAVTVRFSEGFPFSFGVFGTAESAYVAIFTQGPPRTVGVFGTAETGYVAMFTQGAGAPRTAVAGLIERGTAANPVLSDVLFVTRIPGVVILEFHSDRDGRPLHGHPSLLVEETGGLDKMYTLSVPLKGETIDITISAQSDVEGGLPPAQDEVPVPEPGTILFLGSGLLGLAAVCRRLRRS
jgi:PEP-CTERM motif-containing protein